jgi:two-component system CheB/CheR fusion protein
MDSAPESTAATPEPESPEPRFPVVGVGASAGGLESLTALLRALPERPGFALVIIQHLDPAHPSSLAELLGREAKFPVTQVAENTPVEANRAYVIPPTADLVLQNEILKMIPRGDGRGPHFPIDIFFRSLADERTDQAVGVLLSGNGTDGTLGAKAIRGVGGSTFAQDATAKFDGMPRSAVEAGYVDAVLPPTEIAAALLRIALKVEGSAEPPPSDAEALRSLLARVRNVTGVDFAAYKIGTVTRRVQRRMTIHKLERLSDYARYVEDNPVETRLLFEDMLIHVTSFFRDPETFEALRNEVFPGFLVDRPTDSPIRVWVPGCSTGEEVYSLAIALLEFLGDRGMPPIKLFGTDLSEPAIETARAGRYPGSIVADVSPSRLRRFFIPADGGYQINKMVRDLCVFARHDVTHDPPFSNMDLVSCRNVLIYLSPEAQKRVLPIFHYALKPTGRLLLGASETVSLVSELFAPLNLQRRIYSRKHVATRALLDFASPEATLGRSFQIGPRPNTAKSSDVVQEADRLVLAHHAPPGVVVNEHLDVMQFRGDTQPYLELAPGIASLGLLRLARSGLQLPLRTILDEAKHANGLVRRLDVRYEIGGEARLVHLTVSPFTLPPGDQRYFLILFEDAVSPLPSISSGSSANGSDTFAGSGELEQLKQELLTTRSSMQSIIEQLEAHNEELQAANEEVVSTNEELRSTNEELQTAKEELQATNEELGTVNDELGHQNRVVTALSDDLENLLGSAQIPIMMLGRDHRIRRFTRSAARLFNLIPADVGRPLEDMKSQLDIVDLDRLINEVLDTMTAKERELRDREGKWYLLTIRPTRTQDKQLDGVVLTFVDIDALKRMEQVITTARDFSLSVIEAGRHPALILDSSLRVVSANPAFYKTFQVTRGVTESRPLAELGDRQWNIPELHQALSSILPKTGVLENFEFTHDFPTIGRRTVLLNARRMVWPATGESDYILLAIEDITEFRRAEAAVQEREASLRAILNTASDAIITIDEQGRIQSANPATERMFGYTAAELVGQDVNLIMPSAFRIQPDQTFVPDREFGSQGTGVGREVQARRKDGTTFAIDLAVSEASRGSRWFTGIIRDITFRKQLEREVLESSAEEERRIGRELHDGIGQELTGLSLITDALSQRLRTTSPAERELAEKLLTGLQRVQDHVRGLCRDLVLDDVDSEGLRVALQNLALRTQEQASIDCTFACSESVAVSNPAVGRHLYRIAQEAVHNALRHGHAQRIRIGLSLEQNELRLRIEDDGRGISGGSASAKGTGLGIATMRYRANMIGGTLRVEPGQECGVVVTCTVPWEDGDVGKAPEGHQNPDAGTDRR